jgi:acetylornithine deacetylase/succinyl-diaminopimelate desuccinylase-like protein
VIFIEIPGQGSEPVLLYGHLDKQPEFTGWAEGLGPWTPVRRGEKLYGRGGADDGYAMYGALTAILALNDQNIPHAQCVVLIEACEESGSYDLPFYVDHLAARIGQPGLVVCLDSGCGDYDRLWLTTSLRGVATATLTVRVLTEGVHSGDASGIVPSSFRILEQLLARLEDPATGAIIPEELYVQVPRERIDQARDAARVLGASVYTKFPFAGRTRPVTDELSELVLNRTWRPQLAVIGIDGLPAPQNAGNVMLPYTTARLSLRLPPTLPGAEAGKILLRLLESDPPYGSEVSFTGSEAATGWNAPALSSWLNDAVTRASKLAFGPAPAYMG